MTAEIQIRHGGNRYETKSFTFPGGELQVQIPGLPESFAGDITVLARLQSAEALIRLLLTTEVLYRAHRSGWRRLVIPYFPYARQDRVIQPCVAFSLKTIASVINALNFDEVVVCDPHSDVTPALIENVRVIPQLDLVLAHEPLSHLVRETQPDIVAPDAGAAKKAFATARQFNRPLLAASKLRDTKTGEITDIRLDASDTTGDWTALIVDDICDGGRTFIELAKVLRKQGATRVFLYVTHGIFSQGLGVFQGLIDGIYTTDSFLSPYICEESPVPLFIHQLNLETRP